MQELLERVQEYRDAETSPLVVSRLNSVCVDILGMLEKEKDVMCEFAERYLDSIPKEHPSVEDVYNETFNTEECHHKGKYTYNKETFECHKCGLIVPKEYRFNSQEKY